jgi:hypothetical protein
VVEHQKISVARNFEPQVLGPICGSIQSVGKEISHIYKLEAPENLKVQPHISCFIFVVHLP